MYVFAFTVTYTVLNFAILIFACHDFKSRNLVLAKLSENKVQSNLSNTDTEGTEQIVHIREVSIV